MYGPANSQASKNHQGILLHFKSHGALIFHTLLKIVQKRLHPSYCSASKRLKSLKVYPFSNVALLINYDQDKLQ